MNLLFNRKKHIPIKFAGGQLGDIVIFREKNIDLKLNICYSYLSSEEISHSLRDLDGPLFNRNSGF